MLTGFDHALDAAIAAITAPGGFFEVADVRVGGQSRKAFRNAPASLRDYLAFFMDANAGKDFLVYEGERQTFAEVKRRALKIAAMLQWRFGIAKGDRVAIAMRNYPEWISTFIGATFAGAVVVPMNAWWEDEELRFGLERSGVRVVFADSERLQRLDPGKSPGLAIIAVRTAAADAAAKGAFLLEEELAQSPDQPGYTPPIAPDDDATIVFTSGSTGAPKGVVSTNRATVNAAMSYVVQGMAVLQATQPPEYVASPPDQAMLLNVPLFHITGLVPVLLMSVAIGRKLVILYRWDAREALRLIEEERCTYFIGVPTMSLELMQQQAKDRRDLSFLTTIASGGGLLPPEYVPLLARAFPKGAPAVGYGLTETNGAGAGNLGESYVLRPESAGQPSKPLVEAAILDEAGHGLPAGAVGEIAFRSILNARGYWRDAEATAANFTSDGWFRSGDLGRLDEDGFLYVVDRKKDIIIRGGENISAAEVENTLYRNHGVAEAAVFGLPDRRLGEVVGAVVRRREGAVLGADDLAAFAAQELAAFKVPAKIWLVDQPLPRLGSGKIDKVRIKKDYTERYERQA